MSQKQHTCSPFSCSKQLLPKSMTLRPLLAGCRKRTFYGTSVSVCVGHEVNITDLGFQVTVDYTVMTHKNQRTQYLRREAPNQDRRESGKLIRLDQLI